MIENVYIVKDRFKQDIGVALTHNDALDYIDVISAIESNCTLDYSIVPSTLVPLSLNRLKEINKNGNE